MILQTFEGFFNSKKQHPLHQILLNFGWKFNKKSGKYDKDSSFDMSFTFFNEDGLAWKDGIKFPIGTVEGFDMMSMQIETTKNFPIRIGKEGFKIDNCPISNMGDWRPELCSGNFSMASINITNLKGLEDMVLHGDLDLSFCTDLTSLEGMPEMSNNSLDITECHNLKTLYGIRKVLSITYNASGIPIAERKFTGEYARFGINDYWNELYMYIVRTQIYDQSYEVQWPKEIFETLPEEYKNAYISKAGINKYNL